MANVVGSCFAAYPAAGSLSRSALIASSCGATCTPVHGVWTAAIVLLVLVALTPAFRTLPYAVLASIVFTSVKSLLDFGAPRRLWKLNRLDFLLWLVAFSSTLTMGVKPGIALSVSCSLVALIFQGMRPPHALLGRLPGTSNYVDVKRNPNAKQVDGVAIFTFSSTLHFANKDYFRDCLFAAIRRSTEHQNANGVGNGGSARNLRRRKSHGKLAYKAPGSGNAAAGSSSSSEAERVREKQRQQQQEEEARAKAQARQLQQEQQAAPRGGEDEAAAEAHGFSRIAGHSDTDLTASPPMSRHNTPATAQKDDPASEMEAGAAVDASGGGGGMRTLGSTPLPRDSTPSATSLPFPPSRSDVFLSPPTEVDVGESSPEGSAKSAGPSPGAGSSPGATPSSAQPSNGGSGTVEAGAHGGEARAGWRASSSRAHETTTDPDSDAASSEHSDGPGACDSVSVVVIDFTGIPAIDTTALRMLEDVRKELSLRGLKLLLSGCDGQARDLLVRASFFDALGMENVFLKVDAAVNRAVALAGGYDDDSPPGSPSGARSTFRRPPLLRANTPQARWTNESVANMWARQGLTHREPPREGLIGTLERLAGGDSDERKKEKAGGKEPHALV